MKKLLLLSMCLLSMGATQADFKFINALPYPVKFNWNMDINEKHENVVYPGNIYKHNNVGRALRKVNVSVDYRGSGDYAGIGKSWSGFVAPSAIILAYSDTNQQGEIRPNLLIARPEWW